VKVFPQKFEAIAPGMYPDFHGGGFDLPKDLPQWAQLYFTPTNEYYVLIME